MADEFSKVFDGIINASKQMSKDWPYSDANTKSKKDERSELECLALYDAGWKQDGFDYVPNSSSIITHWKKEGEPRKQIYLTFKQQRRWLLKIEERKGVKR